MPEIKKTNCPYKQLPDTSYWRRSVEQVGMSELDPVIKAPFKITKKMKIATAGSCFAQHIARYLRNTVSPISFSQEAFVIGHKFRVLNKANAVTMAKLLHEVIVQLPSS